MKKYLENNFHVCKVFNDLQKAFDTVNHDILLVKREYYAIYRLASSCLGPSHKNRKHCVFLYGDLSNIKTITCDVPGGSTLRLLLLLLYINDL